jgi:hypothetical protein
VLTNIRHGGHVVENAAAGAAELANTQESITLVAADEVTFETPFDYLFPTIRSNPADHLPADDPHQVVQGLLALGDAMVEDPPAAGEPLQITNNSTIPPVYTYWGQFIDHDLTANTDRDSTTSDVTRPDLAPLPPDDVVTKLKNLREPTLNLDSLYGDGPTLQPHHPTRAGSFYDGIKFKIGTNATERSDGVPTPIGGDRIPPAEDLRRDLPRLDKAAQIADARNDENLIIAQLHTAFLRFHNNVVDWLEHHESHPQQAAARFQRARELTRWHYQWLAVHNFLKTVTFPGIADKILLGGPKQFGLRNGKPFMPLEYSVAAFRFGHTMIRGAYDYNRNFGLPGKIIGAASLDLLFRFTGQANPPFIGQTDRLPFNWIIEWDRFVQKGSSVPHHFARKIDTVLAPPLGALFNQGNAPGTDPQVKEIQKRLARRNLLRGYLLSIPTGQSVARELGITPLSAAELHQGNGATLNGVLDSNGFIERTPLWYYVLKEAEVRANGNSLGEVGSRIVCETIIGQLVHDRESYLNHHGGWDPSQGVRLANGDPIVTIGDFLQFAGVLGSFSGAEPPPAGQRTLAELEADNPNVRQQLQEWRRLRTERGEDPRDFAAFRQHLLAIGAPDPGEQEFAGFSS